MTTNVFRFKIRQTMGILPKRDKAGKFVFARKGEE